MVICTEEESINVKSFSKCVTEKSHFLNFP